MTALAGWSCRWSGRVLIAEGPEGRRRSVGEVRCTGLRWRGTLIHPLTGKGLADNRGLRSEEAARAAVDAAVAEHGGSDRIEVLAPSPTGLPGESWGAWCRRRRLDLGFSQRELAEGVGLPPSTGQAIVSQYERQTLRTQKWRAALESVLGPYAAEPGGEDVERIGAPTLGVPADGAGVVDDPRVEEAADGEVRPPADGAGAAGVPEEVQAAAPPTGGQLPEDPDPLTPGDPLHDLAGLVGEYAGRETVLRALRVAHRLGVVEGRAGR